MPMNRAHYPDGWETISREIRFGRAEGRCECLGECGAGNHVECGEQHGARSVRSRGRVVLTVAHLCHVTTCEKRSHMKAMCQRCHLRYDRFHHQHNAAATRRRNDPQMRMVEMGTP